MKIEICKRCKRKRKIYCKDLCRSCYSHINTKLIKCKECGEIAPHSAKGLCRRCYGKKYMKKQREQDKNKQKYVEQTKKWQKNNIEKTRASWLLHYYVKKGKIKKPDKCEICGTKCLINGHHKDYSKPLDVNWVCHRCHKAIHDKRLKT